MKIDFYEFTINTFEHDPQHDLEGVIVDYKHTKQIEKFELVKKSDFNDLQERADQLATQIQGIILCLEKHGSNINPAFLIEHYTDVLKKYRGEK